MKELRDPKDLTEHACHAPPRQCKESLERGHVAFSRLSSFVVIDSGLVGSTDFHSTTRAEDAQGAPTQSHISPSILVYEDKKAISKLGIRLI